MAIRMKNKVKVIAAPVALTDKDLEHYEYWLATAQACEWLVRTPKDKGSKDIVRNFMALYAKIKMAMQAVEEGRVNVCVGKSRFTGNPLVISGEWYDTPEREAAFAMSFFSAYLASVTGVEALKKSIEKGNRSNQVLMGRIKKLEEDLERRDMRIRDLENAVKKSEAAVKSMKNPLARSQGRLPGKRMARLKTVPVKFNGKKREFR